MLIPLFQQEPDHPGLAHYIIHACDSPQMAPTGLAAARAYAEIASSSAHAVHMPSHIFARLGLWQEDIQANLKSVALTQQSGAMYMRGHELHAMHFLLYAYLQTGQDAAAKQIVEQSKQIIATAPKDAGDSGMLRYYGFAAAHFPALYDLEMQDWTDAADTAACGERFAGFASDHLVGADDRLRAHGRCGSDPPQCAEVRRSGGGHSQVEGRLSAGWSKFVAR